MHKMQILLVAVSQRCVDDTDLTSIWLLGYLVDKSSSPDGTTRINLLRKESTVVLLRSHFFQRRSISIRFLKKIAISISFDLHTGPVGHAGRHARLPGNARSCMSASRGRTPAAVRPPLRPPLLKSRPTVVVDASLPRCTAA